MSDHPEHLRDFRAALAAEGFVEGKIATIELSDIMDIWAETAVKLDPITFHGKPMGVWLINTWGPEWPPTGKIWTPPPQPPPLGGEDAPADEPPPYTMVDLVEDIQAAIQQHAAKRAKDATSESPAAPSPPRPHPTDPAAPSTEPPPAGWMARIRRWIAEFAGVFGFRRAS